MIIFRINRALFSRRSMLCRFKVSSFKPGTSSINNMTHKPICNFYTRPVLSTTTTRYTQQLERHKSSSSKTIQPFILPDIGEGIKEVTVKSWLVKLGDSVKEFDEICEVESDKATATITSRYQGTITKIHHETGAIAAVGKPLVDIELSAGTTDLEENQVRDTEEVKEIAKASDGKADENPAEGPLTLPSVRRLANENSIDLKLVTPTGKNGRILKEDVLNYLEEEEENKKKENKPIHHVATSMNDTILTNNLGERETIIPLEGIRRAMFKNMTKSLSVPHFNYSDEIDLTQLVNSTRTVKLNNNKSGETEERKIGQLPFIIKMISLALLEYPQLNGVVDEAGSRLVQKNYHNIGVAVDTRAGLIVPNIKNVQSLSIQQIDLELRRLRQLAYESKLGTNDLSGGTVTLSNIGAIGGVFGVPVLMNPEIVIGALGRIRTLPRYNASGELEKRQIVQIVWSADHRVVDGASLSRFSNLFKQFLEHPESALLRMN